MDIFDIISNDLKEAMKAKDKVALDTLRNIKKALLEAKTAPGAGDSVDDATATKIISKLAKQGRESAELFASQNRPELAAEELAQVAVLEKYLPKQMSDEELTAAQEHHCRSWRIDPPRDGKSDGRRNKEACRNGRRKSNLGKSERTSRIKPG